MIIQNGTIEWKTITAGGGTDPETGYPVPPSEEWSEPVPCQTIPAKTDRLATAAKSGEHFTEISFTVLIEEGTVAPGVWIRLRTMAGNVIGEFPVIGVEPLDAVGQLRITV